MRSACSSELICSSFSSWRRDAPPGVGYLLGITEHFEIARVAMGNDALRVIICVNLRQVRPFELWRSQKSLDLSRDRETGCQSRKGAAGAAHVHRLDLLNRGKTYRRIDFPKLGLELFHPRDPIHHQPPLIVDKPEGLRFKDSVGTWRLEEVRGYELVERIESVHDIAVWPPSEIVFQKAQQRIGARIWIADKRELEKTIKFLFADRKFDFSSGGVLVEATGLNIIAIEGFDRLTNLNVPCGSEPGQVAANRYACGFRNVHKQEVVRSINDHSAIARRLGKFVRRQTTMATRDKRKQSVAPAG